MAFVSELMGRSVVDADGVKVGHLKDLVAAGGDPHHPAIVAVEVGRGKRSVLVPFADVAVLVAPAIPLRVTADRIAPYEPAATDLMLVRDVLDQQIIDINDVRVVRVNDIELARIEGKFYVANVDIGGAGLARRLGLRTPRRRAPSPPAGGMISWDDVEPLAKDRKLRLKVPGQKVTDLHPADLAEIIGDLGKTNGSKLLESLPARTAAETLEVVETDFQASLVQPLPDQKVADVLEEMSPDDAADLLAELPRHRTRELLRIMDKEDSAEVRKLLSYPEDTAGGLMTTEFVTIRPTASAASAMRTIRGTAHEAETIYYVYITDRGGKLQGVTSLKDLVLAEPRKKVVDFMQSRVVSVHIGDSQETVAQVVAKYNLLAVPVVDDDGRLQGIVTVDDALDKIIPTAWKKRMPRLYR
jgi:magnesium transporter